MHFQDPLYFLLIPLIIVGAFFLRKKKDLCGIQFSSNDLLKVPTRSMRLFLHESLFFVRVIVLIVCVCALARPQSPLEESKVETEGIDIVLAVDVSGSMLAEDFTLHKKRVNRLAAVKEVVKDFITGRNNDRIGVVAFASRAYTICPMTLDYGWLLENVERLEIGMIEDGTAIGSGLSSSLNRLKDTKAKGKVVILLTDGRNNAGKISPQTAAEAAKAIDVKVYTIGAGTAKGFAPFPVKGFFGNQVYQQIPVDIDEPLLRKIASETSAEYFRATDTTSLKNIYKEIDRLETTAIEEKGYLEYRELFPLLIIPALLLILLEIVASNTVLRRIP